MFHLELTWNQLNYPPGCKFGTACMNIAHYVCILRNWNLIVLVALRGTRASSHHVGKISKWSCQEENLSSFHVYMSNWQVQVYVEYLWWVEFCLSWRDDISNWRHTAPSWQVTSTSQTSCLVLTKQWAPAQVDCTFTVSRVVRNCTTDVRSSTSLVVLGCATKNL